MRTRGTALALAAAALLAAPPAHSDTPAPPPDPKSFVDPAYDPAAHGGLSYGHYLLMSRGTRRRSTGMMIGGIVLTSVGVVSMAGGTALYFGRAGCDDSPRAFAPGEGGRFVQNECSQGVARTVGMSILLVGTIAVALGVPLWVLGASDTPWAEAAGQNDRAPPRPSWARLVPRVMPERHGAALGWQF